MNFFRPRCARTCPEAYAGIVHACLRSNPRARPSAHVVHSHLWKMSMSTSKAVPDAHPPIKLPLVRWVEDEVAWRFHTAHQPQQGDRYSAAHSGLKQRDAEVETLLEACDLADERPESRETWYHPDGTAAEVQRLEGDACPRFLKGEF